MLVTSLLIVAAVLAGWLANRLIRGRTEDDDVPSRKDMTSPIETLAVLVLAFVLVAAAESFSEADEAATAEAGVVDHMFETADYAPEPVRQRLQAGTVCYARAVGELEWPAMADGRNSPAPSVWTTGFRESFKAWTRATPFSKCSCRRTRKGR
ncbi:hypothetical protein [Amycolatopsis albispora]|uniref:Uncharacterized protein n=1 Tax=Amycolatopsis albispora TaxID=1804986 RepID=A0A344L2T5_9PSEU|nr:hypothetical protein [Amycolatopsis albispora]AXB42359.1 hypothetical protein A4R43_07320 [Amycolatopsis albispora]